MAGQSVAVPSDDAKKPAKSASKNIGRDLKNGAILQLCSGLSLGLPFEVWKTRMARFRGETTSQALKEIYVRGGASAFWSGLGPKAVESASKGAVLLVAKNAIDTTLLSSGVNPTIAATAAGAGAGICQVSVLGPCTFLVTGAVTGSSKETTSARIRRVFQQKGVRGFYPGGVPLAFRQAGNWASREGFTVFTRERIKDFWHAGNPTAKLTPGEEILSAVIGGSLSCWNQPFEVARVEMQSRGDVGQKHKSMLQVFKSIYGEHGFKGLYRGVLPRIGLSIWQTLFMVTGGRLLKEKLQESDAAAK